MRLSIPTLFSFTESKQIYLIDLFHNFFGMNKEEMVEQEQIAKLNLDENKMIKRGGQRKIIFLAIEVWVDVLGFIRRIQLARGVCLANFKIYEICWPRLHGAKVRAHEVGPITIYHRHELGQPPRALLLQGSKELPFPECPPPDYIVGFEAIVIKFLDHQVLAFLSLIAPRITANQVIIQFAMNMNDLDENQVASVNQLLQICREKITSMPSILVFNRGLFSSIPFLPDVDNKMKRIDCYGIEQWDIPILMQFLASPRADGQQRVMAMHFRFLELRMAQKLLDAIKEEFRTSTQPVPQPFYICCFHRLQNLNIPQSEEENPQTDETLTIMNNPRDGRFYICRHPRGQHEQWAEDARKRLVQLPIENSTTYTFIDVDIPEFGINLACPPMLKSRDISGIQSHFPAVDKKSQSALLHGSNLKKIETKLLDVMEEFF